MNQLDIRFRNRRIGDMTTIEELREMLAHFAAVELRRCQKVLGQMPVAVNTHAFEPGGSIEVSELNTAAEAMATLPRDDELIPGCSLTVGQLYHSIRKVLHDYRQLEGRIANMIAGGDCK